VLCWSRSASPVGRLSFEKEKSYGNKYCSIRYWVLFGYVYCVLYRCIPFQKKHYEMILIFIIVFSICAICVIGVLHWYGKMDDDATKEEDV